MCEACERKREDDLKWFALLVRQGLKLIVTGIERRYGLREETRVEANAPRRQRAA